MAYTVPNIATSAETFAQLQAGGLSSTLEALIVVNGTATLAPTAAPTLAESGSAGTLAATTYYVCVTETNGTGETTASPVSSGLAITSTGEIVVTFPSLKTGNTARNTYVGTAAIGPFTLAATGTTASTVTIGSLPTSSYAVHPPTVNSTAFAYTDANGNGVNAVLQNIRSLKDGNFSAAYKAAAWTIDTFLRGEPVSLNGELQKLRHFHTAVATLNQALTDIGTLIDANPGTIAPTATGIGGSSPRRTWP